MEAQVKQHIVNTVKFQRNSQFPKLSPGRKMALNDTLGLNNYAVAKFRYEVDTADYLQGALHRSILLQAGDPAMGLWRWRHL